MSGPELGQWLLWAGEAVLSEELCPRPSAALGGGVVVPGEAVA